ncbi:hypothetical protein PIROE2DRAFT_67491, partial [Piromyces sp. E2]
HTVIETVLLYIPLSLLATSIWERKLTIPVQWVYYTHDGKYRLIHFELTGILALKSILDHSIVSLVGRIIY